MNINQRIKLANAHKVNLPDGSRSLLETLINHRCELLDKHLGYAAIHDHMYMEFEDAILVMSTEDAIKAMAAFLNIVPTIIAPLDYDTVSQFFTDGTDFIFDEESRVRFLETHFANFDSPRLTSESPIRIENADFVKIGLLNKTEKAYEGEIMNSTVGFLAFCGDDVVTNTNECAIIFGTEESAKTILGVEQPGTIIPITYKEYSDLEYDNFCDAVSEARIVALEDALSYIEEKEDATKPQ